MHHTERAVADEFDRWAREGTDVVMERGHGRFTEAALGRWALDPEHRVLDVGCGNGWAVRRMLELGAGEGVGVDLSPEMIGRADPPGAYLVAPAHALPLPDSHFSHVLSVEALYYTADPAAVLREWARVARVGAHLLVLMDLYRENPCWQVWQSLFPFPVAVRGEAEWASLAAACGWSEVRTERVPDPRPVKTEADFEPDDWAPSYADYLGYKRAGTLAVRARR